MPEPAKAPAPQEQSVRITIDAQYNCSPRSGEVNNGGDVYFNVAPQNGCLIHTSPAQAFVGENANGYITLGNGSNGPFVPAGTDEVITYCACAVGGTCDPFKRLTEDGGNTIKVGNPPEPGHRK